MKIAQMAKRSIFDNATSVPLRKARAERAGQISG